MSIELNWDALTGGPDGEALAESIRAFVHDRFQKVALPRMIRSVEVHTFSFGATAPDIELKDVCDPLPDFYDDEESGDDPSNTTTPKVVESPALHRFEDTPTRLERPSSTRPQHAEGRPPQLSTLMTDGLNMITPARSGTPRLVGGMSNLGYFHLPLSAGLSGTSTPLAAVAGARFPAPRAQSQPRPSSSYHEPHSRDFSHGSISPPIAPSTPSSRPASSQHNDDAPPLAPVETPNPRPERSTEDLQVMARIAYDGDVKLSLTAEILLDYPTPSFVGIPLQLHITGVRFDGIGIVAYIRRKAHFCFLAPEDAEALVDGPAGAEGGKRAGGLIEEIRVESEIGQKDGGKQVLKNVGKVEKFVLEQVRKIFEDEFVYPSFWTFLV